MPLYDFDEMWWEVSTAAPAVATQLYPPFHFIQREWISLPETTCPREIPLTIHNSQFTNKHHYIKWFKVLLCIAEAKVYCCCAEWPAQSVKKQSKVMHSKSMQRRNDHKQQ